MELAVNHKGKGSSLKETEKILCELQIAYRMRLEVSSEVVL